MNRTRQETLKKYLAILAEIAKHESLPRADLRKVIGHYKSSHVLDAAMLELNYISDNGWGKPCTINLRNPEPIHAKRLAEVANKRKHPNPIDKVTLKVNEAPATDNTEIMNLIDRRIEEHFNLHKRVWHTNWLKVFWLNNKGLITAILVTTAVILGFLIAFQLGRML